MTSFRMFFYVNICLLPILYLKTQRHNLPNLENGDSKSIYTWVHNEINLVNRLGNNILGVHLKKKLEKKASVIQISPCTHEKRWKQNKIYKQATKTWHSKNGTNDSSKWTVFFKVLPSKFMSNIGHSCCTKDVRISSLKKLLRTFMQILPFLTNIFLLCNLLFNIVYNFLTYKCLCRYIYMVSSTVL